MSESDDLNYDLNELLGNNPPPPPPQNNLSSFALAIPDGVRLTKANAHQLGRKVVKAIRRRNRMKYYLLFSKNCHWLLYWPSVILGAAAATTAFANWDRNGACQGIEWVNILSGVLAVLGAALTAINGAAKFPERESNARNAVAAWGKYADKYETLLNRPYRDHGDALHVMEQAITEYAELEEKGPDIPSLVLKMYLWSSLSKEIGDDDNDPVFNFENEPEILGNSSQPIIKKHESENSTDSGPDGNDGIPALQKALQTQMATISSPTITKQKDKEDM